MTNLLKWKWLQRGLAGILVLAMGAPLTFADDRCERRGYGRDDRGAYWYNDRGYGERAAYQGHRDSGYRYGYASQGYRDYGYRNEGYYGYGDYRRERSAGKSAAIIGGSAAAGAAVGAIAGGGRGAAIGAAVGALGGLVVDRTTRERDRYGRR